MPEFLYIESGRVAVQIFDEDWKLITESEIGRGEMLLLLRGGHALRVLETVRMIEVRQGPYLAESDKRYGDVD